MFFTMFERFWPCQPWNILDDVKMTWIGIPSNSNVFAHSDFYVVVKCVLLGWVIFLCCASDIICAWLN